MFIGDPFPVGQVDIHLSPCCRVPAKCVAPKGGGAVRPSGASAKPSAAGPGQDTTPHHRPTPAQLIGDASW
jgi:hypothetical protein